MGSLDITAFRKALAQLEVGVAAADAEPDREIIRDGAIQRFEYCYELAIKMIKRVLEMEFAEQVDMTAFRDMLRTAAERGLVEDPERWFLYRDQRNRTAHVYDANVAATVFDSAKRFVHDGRFLLQQLGRFSR